MSERYADLAEEEFQEYYFHRGIVTEIDSNRQLIVFRKFSSICLTDLIDPVKPSRADLQNEFFDFYADYGIDGIDGVFFEDYIDFEDITPEQFNRITVGSFIHEHELALGAILPDLDGTLLLGRTHFSSYCIEPTSVQPEAVDDFLNSFAQQRIHELEKRYKDAA